MLGTGSHDVVVMTAALTFDIAPEALMPTKVGSSPEPSPCGGCSGSGFSLGKRTGCCAMGTVSVDIAVVGAHGTTSDSASEISFATIVMPWGYDDLHGAVKPLY
jgi:hypothetical protein